VADYLRHHLCLLGQQSGSAGLPGAVHLNRLRATVRRQLVTLGDWFADDDGPVWQDLELDVEDSRADRREYDLRTFRLLEFLGEIVHCGQGYYLPTPVRLIPLGSGGALVVGGRPTWALRQQLGLAVGWAGLGRMLPPIEAGCVPADVFRQSGDTWMGRPVQDLVMWTEEMLNNARRSLLSAGSPAEVAAYQVYQPHRSDSQIRRWISPNEWQAARYSAGELWLCRSSTWPHRFWLAPLSARALFDRSDDVAPEHARRLMYGLDQRAGRSVSARVNPAREPGIRELTLWSWPAWEELRLLLALAHRRIELDADGRPRRLPLRFRVAETWWRDVRDALHELGIRIVEETTPNP
jgi:hypothetical protein